MNKICCEEKPEKAMCVADYEKEVSKCLFETRAVLTSIYSTLTSFNNNDNDDVGTPNSLMDNVIANNELAVQICSIAKDINKVLFNS